MQSKFEPKYYNYVYAHPLTGNIFYVGKGSRRRDTQHLKDVRNHTICNNRTNYWLYKTIKDILSDDMEPIVLRVFASDYEQSIFENEKKLIEKYKNEGHQLCNITNGGDGFSSEFMFRIRDSISNRMKKTWSDPSSKIRQVMSSEKHKTKISQILKESCNTTEAKENYSKSNKTHWQDINYRDKLKLIKEEWKKNPAYWETRKKVASQFSQNKAYQNKMSEIMRKKWADPIFRANRKLSKIHYKNIMQISSNGELLKIWEDTSSIKRELNISQTALCKCLRGEQKMTQNYFWRLQDVK